MTIDMNQVTIYVSGKQETICLSRETHQRFWKTVFNTWTDVDLYIQAIIAEKQPCCLKSNGSS